MKTNFDYEDSCAELNKKTYPFYCEAKNKTVNKTTCTKRCYSYIPKEVLFSKNGKTIVWCTDSVSAFTLDSNIEQVFEGYVSGLKLFEIKQLVEPDKGYRFILTSYLVKNNIFKKVHYVCTLENAKFQAREYLEDFIKRISKL